MEILSMPRRATGRLRLARTTCGFGRPPSSRPRLSFFTLFAPHALPAPDVPAAGTQPSRAAPAKRYAPWRSNEVLGANRQTILAIVSVPMYRLSPDAPVSAGAPRTSSFLRPRPAPYRYRPSRPSSRGDDPDEAQGRRDRVRRPHTELGPAVAVVADVGGHVAGRTASATVVVVDAEADDRHPDSRSSPCPGREARSTSSSCCPAGRRPCYRGCTSRGPRGGAGRSGSRR